VFLAPIITILFLEIITTLGRYEKVRLLKVAPLIFILISTKPASAIFD